jgi:class 3 adenylate cyclase
VSMNEEEIRAAARGFRNLAEKHAPKGWLEKTETEDGLMSCPLVDAVIHRRSVETIVLCVDIRSSTILMREALDHHRFADILTSFVNAAKNYIQNANGWFDKFTGDGFLAYWPNGFESLETQAHSVSQFCRDTLNFFRDHVSVDFKENSRNFSKKVGVSIGIDAGPLNLLPVAGDLTVIGHPVVGAVRMVGMSAPYEVFANVIIGHYLTKHPDVAMGLRLKDVKRSIKSSKEYPDGQEVYRLIV